MRLEDLDDITPPKADRGTLTSVRRRGRRLKRLRRAGRASILALIAVALVVAVTAATGRDHRPPIVAVEPTTTTAGPVAGAPTTFVSTRESPNSSDVTVAISDARTGKILQTLLSVPVGTQVTGTAIAPTGEAWITLNRGPSMGGHVAGGDPHPHSCSSTLLKIDPRTREMHTVVLGNDDELVSDVQPSPTGNRIAYLQSGCATSYFDSSLRVKDLTTGSVVSIGAAAPTCHVIANPRWTLDGRNIAFLYGKAAGPSYVGALGTCSMPDASHLVVVSAQRSQPGVVGTTAPVDPGCEVNAVAVTSDGYAAVEHCGSSLFISGPARLIRYDLALRPVSRSSLGQCENGASIAGTRTSPTVIISTYQFCGGYSVPPPTTKVFDDSGHGLRLVLSLPGGSTAVDHIAY